MRSIKNFYKKECKIEEKKIYKLQINIFHFSIQDGCLFSMPISYFIHSNFTIQNHIIKPTKQYEQSDTNNCES